MEQDEFWELVEHSRKHSPDPERRIAWLQETLARRPLTDMVDFQICHDRTRLHSDTYALWGAAYQIMDGLCSMDGFWYFQPWLIGLGRDVFERVTETPDLLAGVPEVRRLAGRPMSDWSDTEFPQWESFNYLARQVYEQLTGTEDGLDDALRTRDHETPNDTAPTDPSWNFEDPTEIVRRLPHLAALFPRTGLADRERRYRAAFEDLLAERGQTEAEFFAGLGIQP
jgi:hypothetical protein